MDLDSARDTAPASAVRPGQSGVQMIVVLRYYSALLLTRISLQRNATNYLVVRVSSRANRRRIRLARSYDDGTASRIIVPRLWWDRRRKRSEQPTTPHTLRTLPNMPHGGPSKKP